MKISSKYKGNSINDYVEFAGWEAGLGCPPPTLGGGRDLGWTQMSHPAEIKWARFGWYGDSF